MKIDFKTTRLSELNTNMLIKNVVAELDKPGYTIRNQNKKSIEFKYNMWRFGSRMQALRNVDGGTFEIISDTKTLLVLDFYVSATFEILAICVVAISGIIEDYHIFFFIPFILLMFIIRIISVRAA